MNKDKIKSVFKWFFDSFIWLMILIFVIDIVTKWVMQNTIQTEMRVKWEIIPNFLGIGLSHNLGAAWSMGGDGSLRWLWILISIVLSGALSVYYAVSLKKKSMDIWTKIGLALMISGAVGNMIDRCFYWNDLVGFDGVIDWIAVRLPWGYDFPMFNIADSALVIGVIIIVIYLIIELIKEAIEKGKSGAYQLTPEQYEAKLKEEKGKKELEEQTKIEENNENNQSK